MTTGEQTPRGALIVVEGLDRAGKTSQCHQLIESLAQRGYSVKCKKFPGNDIRFCLHHGTNALQTEIPLLER